MKVVIKFDQNDNSQQIEYIKKQVEEGRTGD